MIEKARTLWKETRLVGGNGLKKGVWIVLFMLVTATLDLLGIALIAPFIGMMLAPQSAEMPTALTWFLSPDDNPLRTLGVILIAVFAIKALSTFVLQGAIARRTEAIRAEAMSRLLDAYQQREYTFHLQHTSSDLINNVVWYTQQFSAGFIGAGMRLVAEGTVFLALVILITLSSPLATALLAVVLIIVFLLVTRIIKHRLSQTNHIIAQSTAELMHTVSQALGGLREVRILGCEKFFKQRVDRTGKVLVDATEKSVVFSNIPRQVIEFSMVLFLVLLVYISTMQGFIAASLIPTLGLIGAAAVRLMPASTSLLSSMNQMKANRFIVARLAKDIAWEADASAVAPTNPGGENDGEPEAFRHLRIENLGFSYEDNGKPVFTGLDCEIFAGDIVGLVGPSGAGKSTLADLLMGFLTPSFGCISVNGKDIRENMPAWRSRVAYIPQQSYLIDDTLKRNVALGIADENIDEDRVRQVLTDVQLGSILRELPMGLDTPLGERGVRFSGGQRQRVALARALYRNRDFLLLDEATSALDKKTEAEIIELIRSLQGKHTLLIITHGLELLSVCNRIIRLDGHA